MFQSLLIGVRRISAALAFGVVLIAPVRLVAQSAAPEPGSAALVTLIERQAALLERLDARVKELEAQVVALSDARAKSNASGAAAPAPVAPAVAAAAPVAALPSAGASSVGGTMRFRGGTEWVAADGVASMRLRGRLQSDFWGVEGSPSAVDYPSGGLVRAIRLGLEGRINPVLTWVAEVDFGVGQTVLNDAYVQYKGKGPFFLRAGNIKPDFSLDNMTGVHQTTFMERALPNTFAVSDETLAIAIGTSGKRWSWGATLFSDVPSVELDGDETIAFATRAKVAPILDKERLLHLGASFSRRHFGADASVGFRVRQRPESRIFATRLVDTGRIDSDDFTVYGAEAATIRGAWSMQAEYLRARAELRTRAEVDFDGGYIQSSWFATGESRPFNVSTGKWGRVKPKRGFGEGGPGALEFAVRYSTLDLSDGAVRGGEQDNLTLGVNWYLTEYSKLMFNWVRFDVEGSAAVRPLGSDRHDGNALGMRVQVDW
jgi:phosphate-selective porin OprO and OprP